MIGERKLIKDLKADIPNLQVIKRTFSAIHIYKPVLLHVHIESIETITTKHKLNWYIDQNGKFISIHTRG